MRDLVRESSRNLLEEFEGPSDLLARPTDKNSTVPTSVRSADEYKDKYCKYFKQYMACFLGDCCTAQVRDALTVQPAATTGPLLGRFSPDLSEFSDFLGNLDSR